LAINKEEILGLLDGVYPAAFVPFRAYGIYVFRFFKNYDWRYVIIDERLPCRDAWDGPKLVFCRCGNLNEFWGPLIEKAYAKLHKTYQSLISGHTDDGLSDMTGLVCERTDVRIAKRRPTDSDLAIHYKKLWEKVFGLYKEGSMSGTSIKGAPGEMVKTKYGRKSGLLAGHAYSIISTYFLYRKFKFDRCF
jgi:calpain